MVDAATLAAALAIRGIGKYESDPVDITDVVNQLKTLKAKLAETEKILAALNLDAVKIDSDGKFYVETEDDA